MKSSISSNSFAWSPSPLSLFLPLSPSFRFHLLVQNRGNYQISAKSMERGTFRAVIVSTSRQGETGWSVRQNETLAVVGGWRGVAWRVDVKGVRRGTNNDERMAL